MTPLRRNYLSVAVVAGAIFPLGLGVRQAQALFIGPINTSTGIGYASISLAFGVGQLMWGVAMPVAGPPPPRWGPRNLMLTRALLVPLATALTPLAHTAGALIVLVGILAAAGAGAMGPSLVMSSLARWGPQAKRNGVTRL